MLIEDFNTEEVHGDMRMDCLPQGKYEVMIIEGQRKTSQSGSDYISLTLQVTSGEYEGRKLFTNLNLWHPKREAVEMARKELKTICYAVGFKGSLQDIETIMNAPMLATVAVVKDKMTGDNRNVIKFYEPCSTQKPVQGTSSPQSEW